MGNCCQPLISRMIAGKLPNYGGGGEGPAQVADSFTVAIHAYRNASNFVPSTTYYFGNNVSSDLSTFENNKRFRVPYDAKLIATNIDVGVTGTLATTEDTTLFLFLNSAASHNIGTCKFSAANGNYHNTGLDVDVLATDKMTVVFQTPAWVTNPTLAFVRIGLLFQLP